MPAKDDKIAAMTMTTITRHVGEMINRMIADRQQPSHIPTVDKPRRIKVSLLVCTTFNLFKKLSSSLRKFVIKNSLMMFYFVDIQIMK